MKQKLVFGILIFLLTAATASARVVLYVDGVHGSDNNNCQSKQMACKTIGHAISLSGPGYVIKVAPATYQENLTVNFDLGIIGTDPATTTIDGQGVNTVIAIPAQSTRFVLAKVTLRGGAALDYCGGGGGGMANYGIVTVVDSIISGNVAASPLAFSSNGGGFCNFGVFTLIRSTVSNNTAFGSYSCAGGGISNGGALTIIASTVSGNAISCTDVDGAGIDNGGTLVMSNSTVYGNNAGNGYFGGGGLSNDISATALISNSTISANTSNTPQGGGGLENNGTLMMQDTIISDNAGGNCSGAVTSNGYNLSDDTTCDLTGPGDLNNTKPLLGPLQNNGGPTQTQAEFLGSPTIDAGNPNGCTDGQGNLLTTDQRGAPRPGQFKHDKRCDMGAFERQND